MEPIRIGCVRFLNTTPLIEGLETCPEITLVRGAPSHLAGMLEDGSVEIALASLIDAARSRTPLAILPVGMIGCDGPTLTVRLFSEAPFKDVTEVHADSESHTSVVLCRVVLEKMFGARPAFVEFDAREQIEPGGAGKRPRAVLLIGDKVVTGAPGRERYPHELDLGEAWKTMTGLPFVYAAWMCRRHEAASERVRLAAALLDRQRRRNQMRLDWIAEVRGSEHRWPVELARKYLREHLRFEIGEREREAAERFVREAAAAGAVEKGELVWTSGVGSAVETAHTAS